jgi:hypothetical protein
VQHQFMIGQLRHSIINPGVHRNQPCV